MHAYSCSLCKSFEEGPLHGHQDTTISQMSKVMGIDDGHLEVCRSIFRDDLGRAQAWAGLSLHPLTVWWFIFGRPLFVLVEESLEETVWHISFE